MNPFEDMSKEERQLLYNPKSYEVTQTSEGNWNAKHNQLEVWFQACHSGPRELKILSESGNEYFVNEGVCSCPDFSGRALRENRLCKHAAVYYAVATFQRKKKEAEKALNGAEFRRVIK